MKKSLFKISNDERGKHKIIEIFGVQLKVNLFCLHSVFGRLADLILSKDKKKIVFFSIPTISDNPYWLYKYINDNHSDKYKCYWLTSNVVKDKALCPKNTFELFSLKGLYHLYTAKFVVSNHCDDFVDMVYSKRHVWLNLWHGMPVKTIGFCEKSVPKKILKRYKKLGEMAYQFATSDIFKTLILTSFNSDYNKCMVTGLPRTDGIFDNSKDAEIREFFSLDNYKKVILYSPTYKQAKRAKVRDIKSDFNNIFYLNDYNHEGFVEYLEKNEILLVVKPHPLDEIFYKANVDMIYSSCKNVKIIYSEDLIDKSIQTYQLFKYFDLMISDFSSIALDYLILNRPIVYLNNLDEEYLQNRGAILEDNYKMFMPGASVYNYSDLIAGIEDCLGVDSYKHTREKLLPLVHKYPDKFASQRIFECMTKF